MSLDGYSYDRWNDFHACGGTLTDHKTQDLLDGAMLVIEATIVLETEQEAVLEIDEVIIAKADGEHRIRYKYRLFFEGRMIFGYDRDAKNHPDMPEHKHIGDRRVRWGPVGFREFVDEVWDWINERREEVRQ